MSDYESQVIIGNGMAICGLAPRKRIACYFYTVCDHCKVKRRHVRLFSGSGWYEDYFYCLTCGENWATGYHPFERGWRKKAIAHARDLIQYVVPRAEFFRITGESIRKEMAWPA